MRTCSMCSVSLVGIGDEEDVRHILFKGHVQPWIKPESPIISIAFLLYYTSIHHGQLEKVKKDFQPPMNGLVTGH